MTRVLTVLTLLSGLGLAGSVCRAQVDGVDMKAAYIFNFAMFTTWPGGGARGPLVVCAHAAGPLWPSLQALNGRPVNGRPWSVTDLSHPKAAHCDIVVLDWDAAIMGGGDDEGRGELGPIAQASPSR